MCPFCFATVAWIAVGATSTVGISALLVKKLRDKNEQPTTNEGGDRHEQ